MAWLRADARAAWEAAVAAVDPQCAVARALPEFPGIDCGLPGVLVVATGKAAVAMLRGVGRPAEAVALIPHDAPVGDKPAGVHVLRGAHPIPDSSGLRSSKTILERVCALRRGETLVYLVSGGTSSLFEVARPGIDEDDLIEAYGVLLGCGAPIADVNAIREALSQVKGGGLARAAHPARVVTLAVSDVGGEDPAVIGSGPTLAPLSRSESAEQIARRIGLLERFRPSILRALAHPSKPSVQEYDPCLVVAGIGDAVGAACKELSARGYRSFSCEPLALRGDAGRCAQVLAERVKDALGTGRRCSLVWGGEVTVELGQGAGTGGRCRHMALRLAELLDSRADFACLIAGTDGCDGSADAAGAVIDGGTADRLRGAGYRPALALAAFDSGPGLAAVGDALVTGPTGTNVGDLLVVTVGDGRERPAGLC